MKNNKSILVLGKAVLAISVLSVLASGCSKSDSKAPVDPTPIPSQLTGEFKAKALSEKRALPTEKEVDEAFLPMKKAGEALPDTSLYADEKKLESASGSEKQRLESSIKLAKEKKSAKQLELQKRMLENCEMTLRKPREIKKEEEGIVGSFVGITVVQMNSDSGSQLCPLIWNNKFELDYRITEADKAQNLVGAVGTFSMALKAENKDEVVKKESGLVQMSLNLNGSGSMKTTSSEFGAEKSKVYVRADLQAEMVFVDDRIKMAGGAEALSNNDSLNMEMYIKIDSRNVSMSLGVIQKDSETTFLMNGNEYQKEEFSKLTEQLFKNLKSQSKSAELTSLQDAQQVEIFGAHLEQSIELLRSSIVKQLGEQK